MAPETSYIVFAFLAIWLSVRLLWSCRDGSGGFYVDVWQLSVGVGVRVW